MKGTIFEQIERLEKLLHRSISHYIEREMDNGYFLRIIQMETGWRVRFLHVDNHDFRPELHDHKISEFITPVFTPGGNLSCEPNESAIRKTASGCANMLLTTLSMN